MNEAGAANATEDSPPALIEESPPPPPLEETTTRTNEDETPPPQKAETSQKEVAAFDGEEAAAIPAAASTTGQQDNDNECPCLHHQDDHDGHPDDMAGFSIHSTPEERATAFATLGARQPLEPKDKNHHRHRHHKKHHHHHHHDKKDGDDGHHHHHRRHRHHHDKDGHHHHRHHRHSSTDQDAMSHHSTESDRSKENRSIETRKNSECAGEPTATAETKQQKEDDDTSADGAGMQEPQEQKGTDDAKDALPNEDPGTKGTNGSQDDAGAASTEQEEEEEAEKLKREQEEEAARLKKQQEAEEEAERLKQQQEAEAEAQRLKEEQEKAEKLKRDQEKELHDMIEAIDFAKEQLCRLKEEYADIMCDHPEIQALQKAHQCHVLKESVTRLRYENETMNKKMKCQERQIKAMHKHAEANGLEFMVEETAKQEHAAQMEERQTQLSDMIEAIDLAKQEMRRVKAEIAKQEEESSEEGSGDPSQDFQAKGEEKTLELTCEERNALKASVAQLQLENKTLSKTCKQQERQIQAMQEQMKANGLEFSFQDDDPEKVPAKANGREPTVPKRRFGLISFLSQRSLVG